ncbi:hypothetical protein BASA81_010758 [Batrachochytrium salamandrivorans]|nr:hypothetical protein BASA81_010758 [Batrachochytrium salamandrivorans]
MNLSVLLAVLVPLATATVVQVHLNCNWDIKDNVFFFANDGQCTTFPGFGSYQADCSVDGAFTQYASDDCTGEPNVFSFDVCYSLAQDYDDLVSQEQSVAYSCAPAPYQGFGVLESFASGLCVSGGADRSRLGYNLNECVSSRLTQNNMFQRNVVLPNGAVQESFYFDNKCLVPDKDAVSVIPTDQCSTLTPVASQYRVVSNGTPYPTTKAPTPKATKTPTLKPTKKPTKTPTKLPSRKPTKAPTKRPTKIPTKAPTKKPK